MEEDIDLGNGMMLRQLPEGSYTYPKTIPTEETAYDADPFARAAARMRQGVKGRERLPVDPQEPYKAPAYLMEPDLLEAQQGAHLPTGIAYNDAGIPFNKTTGVELPMVPRPNVLPVARTPEGLTLAMPKMLDVVGNMMGGVAGAPVKAGEVLLGSGVVRKVPEAVQAVTQGPFFSALERAVETAKVGKASPEQWLGYLKNQPGVKSEEIATVLRDLPEGPISKAELQEIVKANKVELKEIVKGDPAKVSFDEAIAAHGKGMDIFATDPKNINSAMKVTNDKGEILPYVLNNPDKFNFRVGNLTDFEKGKLGTKYHSYQLPGGENYKEMLLTLPEDAGNLKVIKNKDGLFNIVNKEGEVQKLGSMGGNFGSENTALEVLKKEKGIGDNYHSSHWDEPNILAHIRHNDRMVDGKKTLHIEEVQSDAHQQARKSGYIQKDLKELKKKAEAVDEKLIKAEAEDIMGNPDLSVGLKQAVERKIITQQEADDYLRLTNNEHATVPDMPFKKTWTQLAIKRMIHKAATEGYSGISWTPGEAQAARYDLSISLKHIEYKKLDDGDIALNVIDKDGRSVPNIPYAVKADKLEDYVGKEVAGKILKNAASHSQKLEEEGLKIGGEGMRAYYDDILKNEFNSLGKKYKAKVEKREIETDKYTAGSNQGQITKLPVPYFPITPELEAKAKQGFELFSHAPILTPVQHNPFASDEKKSYKLTPVIGNPFGN